MYASIVSFCRSPSQTVESSVALSWDFSTSIATPTTVSETTPRPLVVSQTQSSMPLASSLASLCDGVVMDKNPKKLHRACRHVILSVFHRLRYLYRKAPVCYFEFDFTFLFQIIMIMMMQCVVRNHDNSLRFCRRSVFVVLL